jgi:hypothetical protein
MGPLGERGAWIGEGEAGPCEATAMTSAEGVTAVGSPPSCSIASLHSRKWGMLLISDATHLRGG